MSTGAEITIRLHDVTALEDSSPTCDGTQSFAQAQNLRHEGKQKLPDCATLEKNFFRLDGGFEPFPDSTQEHYWGMWSSGMSGEDCTFAAPPMLRIAFTQSHSSVGITLRFYEREQDYCTHLRVRWLDGSGNVMVAKEFAPQSAAPFLLCKVEGYYGLEITFLKTAKPCRYLKLAGIDYGMELLLSGREISSASLLEEVDPSGSSVSTNTLDAVVYSAAAEFSPLNSMGYFSLFQQNQELCVCAVVDGARREMGSFFLQSWEADSKDSIKLHAVDAVGLMDKVDFYGGVYSAVTAEELLQELGRLTGAKLETDVSIGEQHLSGYLGRCTARQAVGQIALATGGVVDASRGEAVKIYPMPQRPSRLISIKQKFSGQRIGLRPAVTGIDVTTHSYTAGEERYNAFDEILAVGEYRILFSEPTHTPVVTGATATEAGANNLALTVVSGGRVTVNGGRYLHSKQIVTDNMAQQGANLADRRLKVEDATLICKENAVQLMRRLHSHCSNNLDCEFSIKLGEERVADMVVVESRKGENVKGVITSIETDLTGGCIAKIKLSGQRIETLSSSYAGELYAGQILGVL